MASGSRRRGAATIEDVALLAGVSRASAARALGGYGSVSEASRQKVVAAAEQLRYRANSLARSMTTGRTMTLGAVVGDIENDFFARVVRGFTDVAREDGFDTLVASPTSSVANERSAVKVLLERRVDGLVVAPASMRARDHLEAARDAGVPVLLVDRRVPRLGVDTVLLDNVSAAQEAVQHLVAAGHRRIGMVTGAATDDAGSADGPTVLVSTSVDRVEGYRRALLAGGLTYDPGYVMGGDFHLEAVRERAVSLLSRPDRPTAVFTTDGIMALGVLLALRDVGLTCPDDVSVVGFDDPDWASVIRPRLSVMAQPVYEMGAAAARRLVARIRGEVSRPRTQVLTASWRGRQSVAAPPRTVRLAGAPT